LSSSARSLLAELVVCQWSSGCRAKTYRPGAELARHVLEDPYAVVQLDANGPRSPRLGF